MCIRHDKHTYKTSKSTSHALNCKAHIARMHAAEGKMGEKVQESGEVGCGAKKKEPSC